ncbi:ATP-binding protein [Kitasatospora sp. NPDC091207]|uniref:ATP-binding protein n=1 Tax=Kitasatospora sp. NPDC091207 TaxID=3364083 RepID=UPI0037F817A5
MPETLTNPSDLPTHEHSCWLPRRRKSVTIARLDLRAFLAGLAGGERFGDVGELLLTELVANAVDHARVPSDRLIQTRFLLAGDSLRIEVHDASAERPALRTPEDGDESGRGLWLVDQFSEEWGCAPRPDAIGKVVWCLISPAEGDLPPDLPQREHRSDTSGAVVVEIEGITVPATFGRLPDALTAVWDSLRVLPLGAVQYDAFGHVLSGPEAVGRAARMIRREGGLILSFAMNGRAHLVSVRPV